jgi:hypothetical protein
MRNKQVGHVGKEEQEDLEFMESVEVVDESMYKVI